MDSIEQKAGEERVQKMLIEPLMRRGLAKPSAVSKAQFEDMKADICKRLAYMTDANLAALEETVAANPGGKDKDRLPIGTVVLGYAADIQPPGDTASPLMRAVFRSPIGLEALRDGWSPELLGLIRRTRKWPNAFALTQAKKSADDRVRDLRRMEEAVASGLELSARDAEWRAHRLAALRKCEEIRDMAMRAEG